MYAIVAVDEKWGIGRDNALLCQNGMKHNARNL